MKGEQHKARVAIVACLAFAACAPMLPRSVPTSPLTRAEATSFTETSRYTDVIDFLALLRGSGITRGSIGRTTEGREIPFVIASNPRVTTPSQARALRQPIVYVQANIHAGEVEGKEALLALVRDLAAAPRPNVLDTVILIAVPIYNADGNERFASQSVNRTAQNGPGMVGTRANAQGLDLNRDYIKAEAPETRAALAMFNRWDPDVFVDLHTTDGSYHGYALTYAPSLNASAPLGEFTRDSLLPVLRARMKARHNFETFDYGDFLSEDTLSRGWATFDSRPRFGTNYYGLRGRIAILSEAFSHDPFDRRVASTYSFVREVLSLVAENAGKIRELTAASASVRTIHVRSELVAAPDSQDVVAEPLERTGDSTRSAAGVRSGYRRTGKFSSVRMPVFDRFAPTASRQIPAGYLIDRKDTGVVRMLRSYGIRVDSLTAPFAGPVRTFIIDSVHKSRTQFQGHYESRVTGRWVRGSSAGVTNSFGGIFTVTTAQNRGLLAAYLLEPESDDGLVTWNFFDAYIRRGGVFPVRQIDSITSGVPDAP